MKRTILTLAAIGIAASLAACGEKPGQTAAEDTAPSAIVPAATDATSGMAGAAAKTAKGTGAVTAVDAAAGAITINHAPIPEAGWPAMTMGFKISPALAKSVKVGDKVAFDLTLEDGGGEITAISKP